MKPALAILMTCALGLTACGQKTPGQVAREAPVSATPAGAIYTSTATVAEVAGKRVTLDHDAFPGGLPAGRNTFSAYADALAESPLTPGARVTVSYQLAGAEPFIVEMKAR